MPEARLSTAYSLVGMDVGVDAAEFIQALCFLSQDWHKRCTFWRLLAVSIPNVKPAVVDECCGKKDLLHSLERMFALVRGTKAAELFSYPQHRPHTVHKQEKVLHSLSTGHGEGGLCVQDKGGYRCGIAAANVRDSRLPTIPFRARTSPRPGLCLCCGKAVETVENQ